MVILNQNEKLRQYKDKKMFKKNIGERMKIYDTIYLYLSAQDVSNISSLRRLEIRFLPLDPLMITNIF